MGKKVNRKIEAMHRLYGLGEGTCASCNHCRVYSIGKRKVSKCGVFGVTFSEASDWRKRNAACGMKGKSIRGTDAIINLIHPGREPMGEIPGQMSLFDEEVK